MAKRWRDKDTLQLCVFICVYKWENPSLVHTFYIVFYQSVNIIALVLTVKKNSKGPQEQDKASSLFGRSPGVIIIYGRSDAPHSCLLLPPS